MTPTAAETPRCTFRGCAVRYRGGISRLCPMHENQDGDSLLARMKAYGLADVPGQRWPDGEGKTDGSHAR